MRAKWLFESLLHHPLIRTQHLDRIKRSVTSLESSRNIKRATPKGFTILELLIAAAVTVVIVVMLGTMFGSLASTASRANQRTDTFRDARAALQMMARDFSNLVQVQPAAYF